MHCWRALGILASWALRTVQSAAFAAPEPKSQFRDGAAVAGTSAAELEAENPSLRVITDDIAASMDPDIERKRAEAAEAAWGGSKPTAHDASAAAASEAEADTSAAASSAAESGAATVGPGDNGSASQPAEGAAGSAGGSSSTVALNEMTTEELEAELRRRQAARSS